MAKASQDGARTETPGGEKADRRRSFTELAEIFYQGSDAKEMYAAICIAARPSTPRPRARTRPACGGDCSATAKSARPSAC